MSDNPTALTDRDTDGRTPGVTVLGSGTLQRALFAATSVLMVGAISVATGLSVKAHNLTRTLPGSDGDMFGFGPVAVVAVTAILGLPVLACALRQFWLAVRTKPSAPVLPAVVLGLTVWAALVNVAAAAVSRLAVSDTQMYRPTSIERAQDAVFAAGLTGVAAVIVVGVVGSVSIWLAARR